jgi:hypothetical protein
METFLKTYRDGEEMILPLNSYILDLNKAQLEIQPFPIYYFPSSIGMELLYREASTYISGAIIAHETKRTLLGFSVVPTENHPSSNCRGDSVFALSYAVEMRPFLGTNEIFFQSFLSLEDDTLDDSVFGKWDPSGEVSILCREEVEFFADSTFLDFFNIFGENRIVKNSEIDFRGTMGTTLLADGLGIVDFRYQYFPRSVSLELIGEFRSSHSLVLISVNGAPRKQGEYIDNTPP